MMRLRREAALTLIEVLCVVAITGVMMGSILGTVTITARGANAVRSASRLQRTAGGIERVFRKDIGEACAVRSSGSQTFLGRPSLEYSYAPALEFYTLNGLSAGGEGGIRRVNYVLKAVEQDEEAVDDEELFELYRQESGWKDTGDSPVPAERLASNVSMFYAQYFDGALWLDEWRRPTLPDMVRITIGLKGEFGRTVEETFYFEPIARMSEDPIPS